MEYKIKELADLAGVSVRTLQHYDSIGLLKPNLKADNGYRIYGQHEIDKLQQILFYKEIGFPLETIKVILETNKYSKTEILKEQKVLLEMIIEKNRSLIEIINNILTAEGGEIKMTNDNIFKVFKDNKLEKYMDEARERWGNTDAYKQSMEKVKNWKKEDYERIKKEGKEFNLKLAGAMDKDIKSDEVQNLIQNHYDGIKYFYDCPIEMYRNLGNMYITDARFTKTYDKVKPGLAKWLNEAINYYCDEHK